MELCFQSGVEFPLHSFSAKFLLGFREFAGEEKMRETSTEDFGW
jgi:hypothetical protein